MVEFAVCLPLLAILGFGVTDLGRAFALAERGRNAAREAALYAASHPGQLHNVASSDCADPANADWRGAHEGSGRFTFTYSSDVTSGTCNPSPMPAGLGPG